MSEGELIGEIERLRSILYLMSESGVAYNEILSASQELDQLIVTYHHFTS